MEIHFVPLLVCAIGCLVLGSIWYGPLFGKTWMRLMKVDEDCMTDPVKRKAAQKQAMPLYILQFILSFIQIWVLAHFIAAGVTASGLVTSIWIFIGFILPMAAQGSMWNSDSRKDNWTRFWIVGGFNLVTFIALGLVLSHWI
jgi:hypothetical protein